MNLKQNTINLYIKLVPKRVKHLINFSPLTTSYRGSPHEPTITREAIKILKILIKDHFIGFEFGSGASTPWLAMRSKYLISVEHDKKWFDIVKRRLIKKKLNNVDLKLLLLKNDKYSNYIKKFPNEFFDFVFIDGRLRIKCIINSIDKIKHGGMLILDDSEREAYRDGTKLLDSWKKIETSGYTRKTTIWIKKLN